MKWFKEEKWLSWSKLQLLPFFWTALPLEDIEFVKWVFLSPGDRSCRPVSGPVIWAYKVLIELRLQVQLKTQHAITQCHSLQICLPVVTMSTISLNRAQTQRCRSLPKVKAAKWENNIKPTLTLESDDSKVIKMTMKNYRDIFVVVFGMCLLMWKT